MKRALRTIQQEGDLMMIITRMCLEEVLFMI